MLLVVGVEVVFLIEVELAFWIEVEVVFLIEVELAFLLVVEVVFLLEEEGKAPRWYTLSRLGPPQYSEPLPLHAMVQPSLTEAPVLPIALPQSRMVRYR